jgi:hypothetical protein
MSKYCLTIVWVTLACAPGCQGSGDRFFDLLDKVVDASAEVATAYVQTQNGQNATAPSESSTTLTEYGSDDDESEDSSESDDAADENSADTVEIADGESSDDETPESNLAESEPEDQESFDGESDSEELENASESEAEYADSDDPVDTDDAGNNERVVEVDSSEKAASRPQRTPQRKTESETPKRIARSATERRVPARVENPLARRSAEVSTRGDKSSRAEKSARTSPAPRRAAISGSARPVVRGAIQPRSKGGDVRAETAAKRRKKIGDEPATTSRRRIDR